MQKLYVNGKSTNLYIQHVQSENGESCGVH